MKCSDYDLTSRRDTVFDRLCQIWEDTKNDQNCNAKTEACWTNDIWRKANTAQAILQYWRTIGPAHRNYATALNIMKEAYDFYCTYIADPKNYVWVDDYGWWGGFFRDFYYVLPPGLPPPSPFDKVNLLEETKRCYTKMLVNFDDKKGNGQYELGQGGFWNNKNADGSGQKNTITNAWMLNLASDLFSWTGGDSQYKTMAEEQYTWLTTGKYGNYKPPSWALYTPNGLLWWLPNPALSTGIYWSGDVGVFLRGITTYIANVDSTNKGAILDNSKQLINAAIAPTEDFGSAPKGFPDKENVMHESPGSDWSNDLDTGKGVFMRLVTRFAFNWKYFDDKEFAAKLKTFVNATAQSAWCSRDQENKDTIKSNWNPDFGPSLEGQRPETTHGLWALVHQTNGLDALNAAVQISN